MIKRTTCAAAVLLLTASPLVGMAQTGVYYLAPKRISAGTHTSPVAGKGSVTIKVYVHKSGSIDKPVIMKSTNPGDNAAAMELARSIKYRPATRDGKPSDAFYTYILNFSGSAVVADPESTGKNSDLQRAYGFIRMNQFAQAKAQLTTYLQAHPTDQDGNVLLGVADAFLKDNAGAAAAFDKGGTVPAKYKSLAISAYTEDTAELVRNKQYPEAIAMSGHVVELSPEAVNGYYLRGVSNLNTNNAAAAIPDLEKARTLATSAKIPGEQIATITFNLLVAYFQTDQPEKGGAMIKEVTSLDPSLGSKANVVASNYYATASMKLSSAGDTDGAVAKLESGAAAVPADAGDLYTRATALMLNAKTPDFKKAKAEADKALAIDTNNARANYYAGVALANDKNPKDALTYLNKAKANASSVSDPTFAEQVDKAIKTLSGAAK